MISLLLAAVVTCTAPSFAEELPSAGEDPRQRALELYRSGEYEDSLSIINKIPSPDADTLLLKSLNQIRLAQTSEANQTLARLQRVSQNAEQRDLINGLLDQSRRGAGLSRPFWIYADLAAGYDSNVYLVNTSPQSENILRASVGAGARLLKVHATALQIGYIGRWDETANRGDLKIVSHQIQSSLTHESATYFLQAGPYAQYQEWAGLPAYKSFGARAKLRLVNGAYEGGGEIDYSRLQADRQSYSYVSGPDLIVRVYAGLTSSPFHIQFYGEYEDSNSGDLTYSNGQVLPLAFKSLGPGTRLAWKISDDWALSAQAYWIQKNFSRKTGASGKLRADQETLITARLSRLWTNDFSNYLSVSHLNNSSNFGSTDVRDQNYSETKILLGFLWDYF